jgi:hypothetical protein
MDIKEAQYYKSEMTGSQTHIKVIEPSGKLSFVPLDPSNSDYAEILRQVKEEGLTIKDAD